MGTRSIELGIQDYSIRLFSWRNLQRIDWLLSLFTLLLVAAGLIALYSACHYTDISIFNRQLLAIAAGIVLALGLACLDYRFIVSCGPALYLVTLAMLIGVELNGYVAGGSERWLDLGFIRFQPSEWSKLSMVLALTWYFNLLGRRIRNPFWFLLTFVIVGGPTLLILKQPNLGTAATMGPLTIAMLWAAGCRWWHLGAVILAGLSLFPVLALEMSGFDPEAKPFGTEVSDPEIKVNPESMLGIKDYQKRRIYAFLNPEYDQGQRVAHHAKPHQHRQRRPFRQGLPRRYPDPPQLPARTPHRFHLQRRRRGMGLHRRRGVHRPLLRLPLPGADVRPGLPRNAGHAIGDRYRHHPRLPHLRQHRRHRRRHARHRHPLALPQLRTQLLHHRARLRGNPAQHPRTPAHSIYKQVIQVNYPP